MSVLAIDLETKNLSHEISGWENTHLFKVSTVCTWDGDMGTIYIDKAVDDLKKSNVQVKPLSELKFDLDEHFQKGGTLLGHNIVGFDLRVLKDAMDIYCIKNYFDEKAYIDTSQYLTKNCKEHYSLDNLAQHTLGAEKLMNSVDAPAVWKMGDYSKAAEYCLKDCELVYDLWKYGQKENIVKGLSFDKEEVIDLEVRW